MPINLVHGVDGLPKIILTEPTGSSAQVLLYGGQVVSWKNERREEVLFKSSKANLKAHKAIRGGISICFPQFGNLASLELNGFARSRMWALDGYPSPLPPTNSQSSVDLVLKSTDEDLKIWPHCFELRLRVTLSAGKLTLIPRVRDTDNKSFSFVFTFFNYLSVSDISEVRVEGLETLDYLDNLSNRERFTEQADSITFDGESIFEHSDKDRHHRPREEENIRTAEGWDARFNRLQDLTVQIQSQKIENLVVWNPWDKKAKTLQDLGDEDYQSMLCVNSAAIETPIILKPFKEWKGRQEISTVSSSYCSGQLDPQKVLHCFH